MATTTHWWRQVESYLREKYGKNCTISRPRKLTFASATESALQIEKTWYDVLVTNGDDEGFHLVEVKSSSKGSQGSFGAFTIGEWVAAMWSLGKAPYTYEILYVWKDPVSRKTRIDELPLTEKLLEDMLLYPQVKLYFYSGLIQAHIPNQRPPKRPKRRRESNPTMQLISRAIKDTLVKITK